MGPARKAPSSPALSSSERISAASRTPAIGTPRPSRISSVTGASTKPATGKTGKSTAKTISRVRPGQKPGMASVSVAPARIAWSLRRPRRAAASVASGSQTRTDRTTA